MSTGITVIIIIAAIIVMAAVGGIMWETRRRPLRQPFGPLSGPLVARRGGRQRAAAEMASRRRVRNLDIQPLDAAAQARYLLRWAAIQERFVDAPQEAVAGAQLLISTVMTGRGYPTEGSDQLFADLPAEHATVLDHYRAAFNISQRAAEGAASTEDLRSAMLHYGALFQELVGGTAAAGPVAAGGTAHAAGPGPVADAGPAHGGPSAADTVPDRQPPVHAAPPVDGESPAANAPSQRHY